MRQLMTAIFLVVIGNVYAQQVSSPYSRFGIGQLHHQEQTHLRSMGYLSSAYVDSVQTNLSNPASLSQKEYSSFDIGLTIDYHTLSDANLSNSALGAGLTHLAYSFPVNKKKTWAMALGVSPTSGKDYNVTTEAINNSFFQVFEGEGNTQKLFFQNGVEVAKNLSLGVDGSLFFGKLDDVSLNSFLSTLDNGSGVETNQKLRGYNIKLGAQYMVELPNDLDLILGSSYQLESDIRNSITQTDFFIRNVQLEQLEDGTFDLIDYVKFDEEETTFTQDLSLPSTVTFGAFARKPQKWSLGVDAKLSQWKDFETINDAPSVEYRNAIDLSIGGSFIPNYRRPKKAYERFEYRYGVHYSQTYLQVDNTGINDFGLTLGASIPILKNSIASIRRLPSSIDFGLDIGQMGNIDNNLLRDSYIKTSIGLNLNDIWFQRFKYD